MAFPSSPAPSQLLEQTVARTALQHQLQVAEDQLARLREELALARKRLYAQEDLIAEASQLKGMPRGRHGPGGPESEVAVAARAPNLMKVVNRMRRGA